MSKKQTEDCRHRKESTKLTGQFSLCKGSYEQESCAIQRGSCYSYGQRAHVSRSTCSARSLTRMTISHGRHNGLLWGHCLAHLQTMWGQCTAAIRTNKGLADQGGENCYLRSRSRNSYAKLINERRKRIQWREERWWTMCTVNGTWRSRRGQEPSDARRTWSILQAVEGKFGWCTAWNYR